MARPRSFDEAEVLTCAMTTFWRLGFDATTYKVLEGETGVGVRSMHNTFGEKEELFLKALDTYHASVAALMDQVFDPPGIAAIQTIFRGATAPRPDGDIAHSGCLMVNTVFELQDRSVEIDARLKAYKQMLRDRFFGALQHDGISDADQRAEFLVGALWGILSQIRLAGRAEAGAPMAGVIVETISGWA
ncbi:MAG: TetR/AcrR family transcriptional regulator [Pseudomonadota bacterium]